MRSTSTTRTSKPKLDKKTKWMSIGLWGVIGYLALSEPIVLFGVPMTLFIIVLLGIPAVALLRS